MLPPSHLEVVFDKTSHPRSLPEVAVNWICRTSIEKTKTKIEVYEVKEAAKKTKIRKTEKQIKMKETRSEGISQSVFIPSLIYAAVPFLKRI